MSAVECPVCGAKTEVFLSDEAPDVERQNAREFHWSRSRKCAPSVRRASQRAGVTGVVGPVGITT